MIPFAHGPFSFEPGRSARLGGVPHTHWRMFYGNDELAMRTIRDDADRSTIIEAFGDARGDFVRAAQGAHAPDEVLLTEFDVGDTRLPFARWPDLTPGLIDDRSRWWLRSSDRLQSRAITLSEFAGIAAEALAPEHHWITGLLPDSVLTDDPESWRAPTAWEIRHVVGEGSLTGISGAKAASLVGISPQNFRKYTARDDASTRQNMSFAAWHLLLHKLGVMRA